MPNSDAARPRILLLDDDAAVAKALAAILWRAGYAVTVAGHAREAEALLEERFDALILDLRMPGMRGDTFYFLASVRQPWLADRALFITGDITPQAEDIVAATGCRLLHKPFKGEDLVLALLPIAPLAPRIDRTG